jgi:hypothetical protein
MLSFVNSLKTIQSVHTTRPNVAQAIIENQTAYARCSHPPQAHSVSFILGFFRCNLLLIETLRYIVAYDPVKFYEYLEGIRLAATENTRMHSALPPWILLDASAIVS